MSCLAATARRFDFCLKISRDDGHEADILSRFVSAYNTKYPHRQFYALGTVDTAAKVADASVDGAVDGAVEGVSAALKGHLSGVRDFPSLCGRPPLSYPSVWNYYGTSSSSSSTSSYLSPPPISIVMRVGTLISEYNDAWIGGWRRRYWCCTKRVFVTPISGAAILYGSEIIANSLISTWLLARAAQSNLRKEADSIGGVVGSKSSRLEM
jgi:hypothetical protein